MKEKKLNLKKPSDMSMELTRSNFLDLLQVTNANFPIGSFAHSFGFETYIRNNIITDVNSLKKVIKSFIYGQFLFVDLLSIKRVYELLELNEIDFNEIIKLDKIVNSQGMSKETREAGRKIASQMLKIYFEIFDKTKYLTEYYNKVKIKECLGNPGIVFAIFCKEQNIPLFDCLLTHTYSTITALIQNCIRAIPLGQIEGQKIMFEVKRDFFQDVVNKVFETDFDLEFCKNNPSFEISQMNHEDILIRLFMS